MEYTDTAGQPAHGDVWSPGPMAATVWVLVAGGGHAIVHVATRREVPEDRWLGRAGSASSNGPTLSPKLWRDALGFDPRAVVRGEAEQPELVACVDASAEPVDESVPVPDAVPAPIFAPAADEATAEPEPERVAAVVPPMPVGTAVRIDVDTAGRDARVIGAAVEDGRVKVRCEDTIGTVWLLDVAQVRDLDDEPAENGDDAPPAAEPVAPAPRISYRKVVADRKPVARIDYRKPVAQPCADPRCVAGLTRCDGCNGYGVVTAGGRRYRLSSGGRNIGDTAVRHAPCAGTGLAVCGCGRLAGDDRKPVARTST